MAVYTQNTGYVEGRKVYYRHCTRYYSGLLHVELQWALTR
jgi:hypothetical protein